MACLKAALSAIDETQYIGRVSRIEHNILRVTGLNAVAHVGDSVHLERSDMPRLSGEIVQIHQNDISILPDSAPLGIGINAAVVLRGPNSIAPSLAWIGRIVDPDGQPLDGQPLLRGPKQYSHTAAPLPAAHRRALGARLNTGLAALNTILPIVKGQRIGLFAGSGIGKSSLLGHLARTLEGDVTVLALIGERGRELRSFVTDILGPQGMQRTVVVAATSDQSPILRRRCALSAMAVAEFFRDQGKQVVFLADSITRFAQAHREIAAAAGEAPVLQGFPPSTSHAIMGLCERAGPGADHRGDITAVLSVLVAGSDMDEPIADIMRGVLDGHIALDRAIAERGRFPAIDVLRSVSRSLPAAATEAENAMISQLRFHLGCYDQNETMVRAGLYSEGADADLDIAIRLWPDLDRFIGQAEPGKISDSFKRLELLLRRHAKPATPAPQPQSQSQAQPQPRQNTKLS
ncbi:FliI/YscN family ATPase [Cognatishimia sp. WU-CL00825]|uniref:FliI/YscN family ATPase n=1 Tax=Cognatishimia sp. WU-CL00825 TaxID=3127658 RepID=UPI003365A48A